MDQSKVLDISIPESTLHKWQIIVNMLAQLLTVPAVLITRLQDECVEIMHASDVEANPFHSGIQMPLESVCCREALKHSEGYRIPNMLKDEMWNHAPAAQAGLIAYAGFPLFWPNGEVFGTICAFDIKENQFTGFLTQIILEFKDLVESHLALLLANHELHQKTRELESSLNEIQKLRNIIPICTQCKKMRNDAGYWQAVDDYLRVHAGVQFSHGYCPDCMKNL